MKQTKATWVYRNHPFTPQKEDPNYKENPVTSNKKSKPPSNRTKHKHPVPEAVHATSGPADIKFL